MKKIMTMLVVSVALIATLPAHAQVKFGLKGGLNVTEMSFDKSVFETSNRTGFFIGPTVKVALPLAGFGLDLSALYDQRESEVDNQTIKRQTVDIPLNLRYSFGLGSMASAFVFAGPQFSFNVGDDEFEWKSDVKAEKEFVENYFQLKKSDFSLNFGVGFTLFTHFEIAANYNLALSKTADMDRKQVAEGLKDGIKELWEGDTKSNAWQVSLAYYF